MGSQFYRDFANIRGRTFRWQLGLVAFLVLQLAIHAQPMEPNNGIPDPTIEWRETQQWPTDQIELRDGRKLQGLILGEANNWLELDQVQRPAGRAMYLIKRRFPLETVASIDRMTTADRQLLTERLERYRNRSLEELQNMAGLKLTKEQQHQTVVWRYLDSPWFELESRADEELTRRAIVRIEQMFLAFAAILPSQKPLRKERLRVYLFESTTAYREFQKTHGLQLRHQAFYLRDQNILATGGDLATLSQSLATVQQRNAATKQALTQITTEMPKKMQESAAEFQRQGRSTNEIKQLVQLLRSGTQREVTRLQDQLSLAERKNSREFENFTRQMFQSLYHEAFHAYLENFVFPGTQHDVPRWLNEGLAQVFEEGVLEAGTLRLDIPSKQRLVALQKDLATKNRLPLSEVLSAEPQRFLVGHEAAERESERLYLYSWGLAYYLVIREPVLQTKLLQQYVQPEQAKLAPQKRLEQMLNQPLDQFERRWRTAIMETPIP